MKFKLTTEQVSYVYNLAKARHDAKNSSFRNSNILVSQDKKDEFEKEFVIDKQYLPHFLGLVGELAWSLKTGESVDEAIYKVRDKGEDFEGIEIKTVTYSGPGEKELKIKVAEYSKKIPKKYVLVYFDLYNKEVEILGSITRVEFDKNKVEKKYGRYLPSNYVVPLSKMEKM
jgi:hypothetical protein